MKMVPSWTSMESIPGIKDFYPGMVDTCRADDLNICILTQEKTIDLNLKCT